MRLKTLLLVAASLTLATCRAPQPAPVTPAIEPPQITHGVAAGEVTATSATLWARCSRQSWLVLNLREVETGAERSRRVLLSKQRDYTGRIRFDGLTPRTEYQYRAWCLDGVVNKLHSADGAFHTAPAPTEPSAVRLAWSGDVGGQDACRDRTEGYAIFDRIAALSPDFFIALGDMIYADGACHAVGRFRNPQVPGPPTPATDRPEFWEVWKYNRSDAALQRFLAATTYYAVWDDHEIMNDAGPQHDILPVAPERHLIHLARDAFVDYQPLAPPTAAPTRLYRSVRWGRHLEVFFLDTRQYRDANGQPDSSQHPKTMLGAEQRRWLIDGVTHSDATWKVIVSSVPMSIPTGTDEAHDGWANFEGRSGFEEELLLILRALQRGGVRNQVWVTTDVHFATGFRYTPFADDPHFTLYEFTSGPLNAGVFSKSEVDPTLHPERLFLYGPASADAIHDYAEAKSWFNFGVIDVSAAGGLTVQIVNGLGATVYEQTLALQP